MVFFLLACVLSDDVFGIDEVTIYDGEYAEEKTYAVAGEVLDGVRYN